MFQHTYPIHGAGLAALAFQAGIVKRLQLDAALSSLLPGGLYDLKVPDAANNGRGVSFPYGVVLGATEVPQDRLTTVASNVSVPIAVYSQYMGSKEVLTILKRITMLLHRRERDLQIEGWVLNRIALETSSVFEDLGTIQGQVRFGGLLQPIP